MIWVPIVAWCAVVVLAAVVLGFCAYEISWKAKRLRTDLAALQSVAGDIAQLQGELAVTKQRLAATGLR